MEGSVVCPVCTLYLRPGMTLKSHLESHPKQKVIEALVKLHSEPQTPAGTSYNVPPAADGTGAPWLGQATTTTAAYHLPAHSVPSVQPPMPGAPTNHSFIYQQIIGSAPQPQGGYLIPVFNQQIPVPGYMYHQQQMFVSGGAPNAFPLRMLPSTELAPTSEYKGAHIVEINDSEVRDNPDLVILKDTEYILPSDDKVDTMPALKSQMEIGNTQVHDGGNVDAAAEHEEYDSGPPQLRPEASDVEDELQEKFKDLDTSPNYITLNTAEQTADTAADEEQHRFELDGINIVLVNDFNNLGHAHLRVAAEEECEEGISIDSAHIRADENMPQESNSNASWSRAPFHEGSSRMSTYDLLARESWEGSDVSDVDADAPPPYQSHYPLYKTGAHEEDPDIMISSTSRQGIEYKCSTCPLSFVCPKERRVHQAEVHGSTAERKEDTPATTTTATTNMGTHMIGSALYSKKVKKLVIKPKKQTKMDQLEQLKTEKVESPASFDQIFTNIMKVEDERQLSFAATPATDPLQILDRKEALSALGVDGSASPSLAAPAPVVICVLCCTVVRTGRTLRQHQVEMHAFVAETKYKCGVCGECFAAEPAYTEHLSVHPLECLFCGKYFHRAHNMAMHIKRHLGIRPFQCPTCGKHFFTRQKLQEHQYIHTGEAPLKCGLCDETFKRYSNLIQHRNRRHLNLKRRQKDFICATCGDVFHSKKKLAWHKEVHENRPKACLFCSEKFVHQSSLTRHVRRAHNERFVPAEERDAENVECPICKGVYLRGSLDTHIKSHEARKGFSCSVCDKEFSTKWNLKLHKWTHAGRAQKPFKCELCKGAFVREADYTAHMNSHRAIRPYTCNYCGAQFIRKYNCQRHVKEHERMKTFNCTVCGKKFHRSYYLNDHMRIHSGVRPFSCHICGKTSTTKSNHNKHVRIHHAREPVSTEN
ncbi:uncharacterized protein [Atheta coriaria]|uniref:uncharacterized protein n=1 Tax=Dalotia coriaria TaxID=877792 RepID=UPI0031F3AFBA